MGASCRVARIDGAWCAGGVEALILKEVSRNKDRVIYGIVDSHFILPAEIKCSTIRMIRQIRLFFCPNRRK